jgi:hypothetical protein
MTRQIISSDDAPSSNIQHTNPCTDCPFARTAVRGWLGGSSPMEYVMLAHDEERIDCHAINGPQCAGAAIYRSNVCKSPRDKTLLILPADRVRVFANTKEFLAHHNAGPPGLEEDDA